MAAELHYYDCLGDNVTAFTTTRHGGYSKGNWASLNINAYRGDNPDTVEANLKAVADELGIAPDHIVRQHQVHETELRMIDDSYFSKTETEKREMMEGVDGVATSEISVCIGAFTADCIPLLFHDPVKKVVAAAHAGWRGTKKRIAEKMVAFLGKNFGTQPKDVRVLVGPGITFHNFEVGQEVYDEFAEAGFDMEKIAGRMPAMHPETDGNIEKWHIDLPQCNRLQLIESGVRTENITLCGIDTVDNSDDYFSARTLKKDFGTMYTGILLR